MKIYFAGSIRAGRNDADIYLEIINHLKKYGEVLTEHVGNEQLSIKGEKGLSEKYIYDRDLEWLISSDVIIAEVTTPSLGVGYEIRFAVEHNKKILCLYKQQEGKKLSAMVLGCPQITNVNYDSITEAKKIIDDFLKF